MADKPVPYADSHIVFVLGGPGAGKGTQSFRAAKELGYVHMSAGDLLRAEKARDSENSKLIAHYIKEGLIVPAEITVDLLREEMERRPNRVCRALEEGYLSIPQVFLIDGFPRAVDQQELFVKKIKECAFVLWFDCYEDVMMERLLGRAKTSGRSDDNKESIAKRFKVYQSTTMPVVKHYEAVGKVRRVDACGDRDTIFASVKEILKEL